MFTNDQIILEQLLEDRKRDEVPELSEADFFETFCAEQILKDYDVSYDEVEEGVVGGGHDGGIDSIYTLINGELIHEDTDLSIYRGDISIELHIVQSKRSNGFSEGTIHNLIASAADLLSLSRMPQELAQTYNEKLIAIIAKVHEACRRFTNKLPKLAINYYYATLGVEAHPNVHRQVDRLRDTVKGLFSSADFSFRFLGAKELLNLARSQPRATYTLTVTDTIAANNSFICLVRLSDYRDFITDDEGHYRWVIFDANVRDYQGDVEVNRAIRLTLLEPGEEDFWWLNNGITILATEASQNGKTLTIRDPRVVNGLQTSQEVFRAFKTMTVSSEDRGILIRVIIIPQSSASYQRIVRATNSQTSVPSASLRATDLIHRDIEDYLKAKGFYYERRKNYYKNEGRPREKTISIPYLAQATMAVLLGRADDARARPSTLIKNDEDYKTVFNPCYPMSTYFACVMLMKRVEMLLRSKGFVPKEVNNLKYHLAMFAARRALNVTSLLPTQLANLPSEELDDAFLYGCFAEVNAIYIELGAHDQASKGTEFIARLNQRLLELAKEAHREVRSANL